MSDDLPAQACVVFLSLFPPRSLCRLDGVRRRNAPTRSARSRASTPTPSTRRAETPDLYFKRLELVLRLAHVGLEEGERAELLDPISGISIDGIVSFMDLDATEHALLFRQCR